MHRMLIKSAAILGLGVVLASPLHAEESAPPQPVGAKAPHGAASDPAPKAAVGTPLIERDIRDLLEMQDIMCRERRRTEARKLFRTMLKDNPESVLAAFLHARLHDSRAGRRKMRAALEQRLGLPATETAQVGAGWHAMAKAHVDAEEFELAAEAATFARLLLPSANACYFEAWIAHRRNKREDAMNHYVAALRHDPWHMQSRFALCPLLLEHGEVEAALSLSLGTLKREARSSLAHVQWGMSLAAAGNAEGAKTAYATALRLVGTEPGRVAAIASALRGIGEASLARPAIDAALAEHPKHYGLLLNRGLIEVDHGNYREAAGYFDQARKLAPREASTHYLYGVCLERSGKARKAISVLKKATLLSPNTLVYRLALGRAFRAADRLDSAISVYRKAIKEFPDNAHVQQVYARALFDDKKYKQASKEYERLITMQPDEPAPRFLLAIAYGQYLGKPKEAYRLLKEYEELGGEEPGALRWLKQLEHRYGKKK